MPEKKTEAAFIEPVLLLRTENLPEGPGWLVELFLRMHWKKARHEAAVGELLVASPHNMPPNGAETRARRECFAVPTGETK